MTRLNRKITKHIYSKVRKNKMKGGGFPVYRGRMMRRTRGGFAFGLKPLMGLFKSVVKGVGKSAVRGLKSRAFKSVGKTLIKEVKPTVINAALSTGSRILAGQNPKKAAKAAFKETTEDLIKKGKKLAFLNIAKAASKQHQKGGRMRKRKTKLVTISKRNKNIFGD